MIAIDLEDGTLRETARGSPVVSHRCGETTTRVRPYCHLTIWGYDIQGDYHAREAVLYVQRLAPGQAYLTF